MALAYPKLALPDAPETAAFRAVERILKTDPTLKRVVRQWTSWDGDPTDVLEPTFSTCPYLRISPLPSPSNWEDEGQHKMPMTVGIQAAVAGSDVDQLMNFWAAVRRALWPSDPARFALVRQTVLAANITRPVLVQSAYGCKLEERGVRLLVADGRLNLILLINTP